MAHIETAVNNNRKAGVRGIPKSALKIDMTPMVDLGFLLISFFMITVELKKPKAMSLFMPKDEGHSTPVKASTSMTILIDKEDKLYYYLGEWEGKAEQTNFSYSSGVGKVIREKQTQLLQRGGKELKDMLTILIKPGKQSNYKSVVDILDEMTINGVKRYSIVDLEEYEVNYLKPL